MAHASSGRGAGLERRLQFGFYFNITVSTQLCVSNTAAVAAAPLHAVVVVPG